MFTDAQLEAMLEAGESDRVEFKQSISDKDRIRQALCAFANDLPSHDEPGVLFVGVDDQGLPKGSVVDEQARQTLADMKYDGRIVPPLSMDLGVRVLRGSPVLVAVVHPSSSPPVRLDGVAWIRSGPRRGRASPDDERRLNEKRRWSDLPADIRPLPSADLDAIDDLLFRRTYLTAVVAPDVIEENDRPVEHQLLACKFAHPSSPTRPTLLGILAAGRSPRDWCPCAYVQFVRYEGSDLDSPILLAREIDGPLPDLLGDLDDTLRIQIRTAVEFTSGPRETRASDYPIVALEQIVRNAILHRLYEATHAPVRLTWFEDRVEIYSPGGPFGLVTRESFGRPNASDYRNPNLAAVMRDLGYVQRFGVGIAIARREMEKNGNPPIEFEVEDDHVLAILRRRT